ncbi:helix-turn-helix transcriptional regulator [Thiomicrorhabdus sp.]|uniref:helix-turn-helix transcriptional regulator n=1 Tax=Thiomicrorhabdus sp. TaxID=2039724 RepID=UPI0035694BEF
MSKKISEKIREIREAEGLTQTEFGERIEVGKVSVARYEGGTRSPNLEAIQKICAAFPHYTMYLMFDEMPVTTSDDQITPEEKKLRDLSTSEKTA